MMNRFICLIFLLFCGVSRVVAGETSLQAEGKFGRQGTLVLGRDPLVTMQPTRLTLQITAPAPLPVQLQAYCNMTMPAMPMPPNRPVLKPKDGKLVGEVIFTMAGAWRANCTVEYRDAPSELFVFYLDRVLMK